MKPDIKVGGVELGEAVIKAYATDADVTPEECEEIGLSEAGCSAIADAVDGGMIDALERKSLSNAGFAKEFIDTISGGDGKRLSNVLSLFRDISVLEKSYTPLSADTIMGLLKHLKDGDPLVKERAAHAFMMLVNYMIDEMDEEYFSDYDSLDRFEWAIPDLTAILKDPATGVRGAAAWALEAIDWIHALPESVLAILLEMIENDPDPKARYAAVCATSTIVERIVYDGPSKAEKEMIEKDVMKALIGALGDEDDNVGFAAGMALDPVLYPKNTKSDEAFDALVLALEDGNAGTRAGAAYSLRNFGPKALPALIGAIGDDDHSVLSNIVGSLSRIGSPKALPALKGLLDHDSEYLRDQVAKTIKKLKGKKKAY
jgi:HEAT repeat protein